ncbi:MAG: MurR/RpiR family transcriptional regulator [Erysipelotrichaceae bacterium]
MIKSKIKSMMQYLSKSEMMIADFIMDLHADPRTLTSSMLAEQLNVAQSTVIRFTQKLGYPSFREFLVDLNSDYSRDVPFEEEVVADENTEDTNLRMLAQYYDVLNITHRYNPAAEFDKSVALIRKARKIVLFGVGNSSIFCEYLGNQLNKLGFLATSYRDTHTFLVAASMLDKSDLLILVSESGETKEILDAVTMAKHNQVPILAITGKAKSTLQQAADAVLTTIVFETDTRLNLLTVRVSQLMVIDLLYINLFKSDFKVNFEKVQNSDSLLRKQLKSE